MRKLTKYLGTYACSLILALACVVGQAVFELQLPAQMARLVNVGIQAHGAEHTAPRRITQQDLDLALSFLTPAERAICQRAYRPGATRNVLVRADLDASSLREADDYFSIASAAIVYAADALPGSAHQVSSSSSSADLSELDFRDLREVLRAEGTLSEDSVAQARQKALRLEADVRTQMGQAMAASFYAQAGGSVAYLETIFMTSEARTMIWIVVLASVFSVLVTFFASRGAAGFARNLRSAVFAKAGNLPEEQIADLTDASLLSRTTSDINLVQSSTFSSVRIIAFAFCMGAGGAIMATQNDTALGWLLALATITAALVLVLIFCLTRPPYRIVQSMIDKLNMVGREEVEGAKTIRAFNAQRFEEARYDAFNDRLSHTQLKINRLLSFLAPSFAIIANVVSLFVVWNGAYRIQTGMQVGQILAYGQYAAIALGSFGLIAGMFVIVPRVTVSADRIMEVLQVSNTPTDAPAQQNEGMSQEKGIRFAHVSYAYPGRQTDVVKDMSFCVPVGELTAVIGKTGCGKTTIVRLIEHARTPQSGSICLNGRDIAQMDAMDVRQLVSVVPQKASRLSGPDAAFMSAEEAATWRICGASGSDSKDISQSPDGAVTDMLSEEAWAYVIDDMTDTLDPDERAPFFACMRERAKRASVLFMSHSVHSAMHADRILVLENGCITAKGTHAELLAGCASYKDLAIREGLAVQTGA